MALQFRCHHCRQLLGISPSRAGTLVDCPACGRSVRVPGVEGPGSRDGQPVASADQGLLDALRVLSDCAVPVPASTSASPAPPTPRPTLAISQPRPQRRTGPASPSPSASAGVGARSMAAPETGEPLSSDSMELFRELAAMPPGDAAQPGILPELVEPELLDEPDGAEASVNGLAEEIRQPGDWEGQPGVPREMLSALQELGALAPQDPLSVAGAQPATQRSRLGWASGCLVAGLLGGMLTGYLIGRWSAGQGGASERNAEKNATAVTGGGQKAASDVDVSAPSPAFLSGRVVTRGADGQERPDADALCLLLPTDAAGVLLDPRPLRDNLQDTRQAAILRALETLGGSSVRADADGRFRIPRMTDRDFRLVVISRQTTRAADMQVPDAVMSLLGLWFQSPQQLVGRLQSQVVELADGSTIGTELAVQFLRE